jgi:hypothetical protein
MLPQHEAQQITRTSLMSMSVCHPNELTLSSVLINISVGGTREHEQGPLVAQNEYVSQKPTNTYGHTWLPWLPTGPQVGMERCLMKKEEWSFKSGKTKGKEDHSDGSQGCQGSCDLDLARVAIWRGRKRPSSGYIQSSVAFP